MRNILLTCLLVLLTLFVQSQDFSKIQVIYYADVELDNNGYNFLGNFEVIKVPAHHSFETRLNIEYKYGDQLTSSLPENRIYRAYSLVADPTNFIGFYQYKIKNEGNIQINCILVEAAEQKDLITAVQELTNNQADDIELLDLNEPVIINETFTKSLYQSLHEKINPLLDPIEKELIFRSSGTITGTDY